MMSNDRGVNNFREGVNYIQHQTLTSTKEGTKHCAAWKSINWTDQKEGYQNDQNNKGATISCIKVFSIVPRLAYIPNSIVFTFHSQNNQSEIFKFSLSSKIMFEV